MTSELHKVQRPMKDLVKWTAILSLNLNSLLDRRLETFGINRLFRFKQTEQSVCLYIESMQEPGNNERMHFP